MMRKKVATAVVPSSVWLFLFGIVAVRTASATPSCFVSVTSRLASRPDAFLQQPGRGCFFYNSIQKTNNYSGRKRRQYNFFLQSTTKSPEQTETTNADKETTRTTTTTTGGGSSISEVDARVLRTMLSENKLDLETESDVRKLLERGTIKTVESRTKRKKQVQPEDNDSGFSSQVLKTLADTKLWKKLSVQASDAMESVGIWVSNKVEQDVKVLAALGLFAWDRAVRDVARALPAAGSQAKKRILILTNSSSFQEQQPSDEASFKSVKERMVRPEDEIKSVSREILGILKGEQTSPTGGGQGLRTVAPAGWSVNNAERQRRAYRQRQKMDRQKKDVTKIGGSVVDGAWELRRELKAEANIPGYKTEPARKAIQAGVRNTGNMLRAAQEQARLAAARRQELRLQQQQQQQGSDEQTVSVLKTDVKPEKDQAAFVDPTKNVEQVVVRTAVETEPVVGQYSSTDAFDMGAAQVESMKIDKKQEELIAELQAERIRVTERLKLCIDSPSTTWLTASVVDSVKEKDIFEGHGMEDSIAKMILLKDQLVDPANEHIDLSVEVALGQLSTMRDSIEELLLFVAYTVSGKVSDQLRIELFEESDEKKPLILRLDEVAKSLASTEQNAMPSKDAFFVTTSEPDHQEETATQFVNGNKQPEVQATVADATPEFIDVVPDGIIDVIPDAVVTEMLRDNADGTRGTATVLVDEGADAVGVGLVAEIVTDEDFDSAVGAAKVAVEVTANGDDDEETKKEDSVLVQMTLRSLDIVFFVLEKIFTVGVPGTTAVIKTALIRFDEAKREGKGSEGWQQFGNLAETKGKY